MEDKITVNGVEYFRKAEASNVRIVVMDRGFVVVGSVEEVGDYVVITGAKCVRVWGTSKGLGQLASDGPTSLAKLDPQPTTRVHKLQVVQMIDCEASKWTL